VLILQEVWRAIGRTRVPKFIRNLRDFTGVLARGGVRVPKP
jgi:hypothetical protein